MLETVAYVGYVFTPACVSLLLRYLRMSAPKMEGWTVTLWLLYSALFMAVFMMRTVKAGNFRRNLAVWGAKDEKFLAAGVGVAAVTDVVSVALCSMIWCCRGFHSIGGYMCIRMVDDCSSCVWLQANRGRGFPGLC